MSATTSRSIFCTASPKSIPTFKKPMVTVRLDCTTSAPFPVSPFMPLLMSTLTT